MSVAFEVNGVAYDVALPEDTPLVYVLRNDLGLKGTRFGCGTGECGACFVLIDGRVAPSCDTPLWAVSGKKVTTVEGLGSPERPHPIQAALLAEQAGQCGYCLAGIEISAAALLDVNPQPSEVDIRQALAKNLCRCGVHERIIRALRRAASASSSA